MNEVIIFTGKCACKQQVSELLQLQGFPHLAKHIIKETDGIFTSFLSQEQLSNISDVSRVLLTRNIGSIHRIVIPALTKLKERQKPDEKELLCSTILKHVGEQDPDKSWLQT